MALVPIPGIGAIFVDFSQSPATHPMAGLLIAYLKMKDTKSTLRGRFHSLRAQINHDFSGKSAYDRARVFITEVISK